MRRKRQSIFSRRGEPMLGLKGVGPLPSPKRRTSCDHQKELYRDRKFYEDKGGVTKLKRDGPEIVSGSTLEE